jgi:hypothetical protein
LDVLSPSKEDTLLSKSLAVVSFEVQPLSVPSSIDNPLSIYKNQTDKAGEMYIKTAIDTLREVKFYSLLTEFTPNGLIVEQRAPDAGDKRMLKMVYPHASAHSVVTLPASSEPEIFVGVPEGSCIPPYTAEVKSISSGTTFYSEIFTYSLAGLVESFFPTDLPGKILRFYDHPPIGFAITGAGYLSHISVIEWVGQLRVQPWSDPFYLGSPQHQQAVTKIDDLAQQIVTEERFAKFVDVTLTTGNGWSQNGNVMWAVIDDTFWKIIIAAKDAKGEKCRDLFKVYRKYHQICLDNEKEKPAELVIAKLLFGQFALAVQMDAVGDSDLDGEVLDSDAGVQSKVAGAIVFLARHGLLYTDLRCWNVRVSGADVWLVDYDDMVEVQACSNYEEFSAEMSKLDSLVTYKSHQGILNAIEAAYSA